MGYTVVTAESDQAGHVDELLHAKILDTVTMDPTPGVIVIVSGK